MNKNVLLIYPDMSMFSQAYYSGIGYLSTALKKEGFKPFLIHIIDEIRKERIIEIISKTKPILIGISTTTHLYEQALTISKWIKEEFDIPIMFGGIHPTLNPEETIYEKNVDMICIGEGEKPIVEAALNIINDKKRTDIKNIWFKIDGKIIRNDVRKLNQDLDSLGFPDREIFDFKNILKRNDNTIDIMGSRGCPFQCTYCCNHALLKTYAGKGKYVRFRSVEHIVKEIENIIKKYNIKKINFDDDTFTLYPEYIKKFAKEYKKKINIPFTINSRVETASEDVLKALKEAGCEEIRFGIECGNEEFRKKVLKRFMTNEQIKNAFKVAKKSGIKTYGFSMVGFPYENEKIMKDTLTLNEEIQPDAISVSIFYPYKGTELYDICKKERLLTKEIKTSYFDNGTTLAFNKKHKKLIAKYYKKIRNFAMEQAARKKMRNIYPLYNSINRLFSKIGLNFTPMLFRIKKIVDDYLL